MVTSNNEMSTERCLLLFMGPTT